METTLAACTGWAGKAAPLQESAGPAGTGHTLAYPALRPPELVGVMPCTHLVAEVWGQEDVTLGSGRSLCPHQARGSAALG